MAAYASEAQAALDSSGSLPSQADRGMQDHMEKLVEALAGLTAAAKKDLGTVE